MRKTTPTYKIVPEKIKISKNLFITVFGFPSQFLCHRKRKFQRDFMSAIVVLPLAPFNIIAAIHDSSILGYEQNEIVGKSVFHLTGPFSDVNLLRCAMYRAASHTSSTQQLVLYDRDRRPQHMIVLCSPLIRSGILLGCLVLFRPSFAITLQHVFKNVQQSSLPYCLVSAMYPHNIHMVNEGFMAGLGCSREDMLGKDLLTVIELTRTDCRDWNLMLGAASRGAAGHVTVLVRSGPAGNLAEVDMICLPVVETPNGPIRHFTVLFLPGPTSPSTNDFDGNELHRSCMDAADGISRLAFHHPQLAQIYADSNILTRSRSPESESDNVLTDVSPALSGAPGAAPSHAVLPRFKPRSDPSPRGKPVVLTLATLDVLGELSLAQAAQAVGLSATAFKRACRRLGLKQWRYRRHRGAFAETRRDSEGAEGGPNDSERAPR